MRIQKNINQPPAESISNLTQGRPLVAGPVIDEKVQKFLMALFKKDRHMSYKSASTAANVLLSKSEDLSLKNIKTILMSGHSIFQRLRFWRRVAATGKVEVPEGARKDAGPSIISDFLTLWKNITFRKPLFIVKSIFHSL